MSCANCGFENLQGAKFCMECGVAMASGCPSCGVVNLPNAKFCMSREAAPGGAGAIWRGADWLAPDALNLG